MVRVASYNLYLGADLAPLFDVGDADELAQTLARVRDQLDRTSFEERAVAVAGLLRREAPDLVGLQEVTRWTTASRAPEGGPGPELVLVDFLPTLVAALETAGCAYDVHAASGNFTGAAWVSQTEWVSVACSNVTLVRRGGPAVIEEAIGRFGESLTVTTGMEGLSFPIVRSWGRVDVRVDGAQLRFVNTHLEAWDGPIRAAQRDELLALNSDVQGAVVLVGDLNATPDILGMPEGWVDAWSTGDGDGFTCGQAGDLANEESTLHERIDYVWARDCLVRGCRTIGDTADDRTVPHSLWPSDHAAVVADLEVAPPR